MAFKAGMPKADPTLLEPVFEVEVETPDEYMGDVIGDLSSRRGRILSMEQRGKTQIVTARVPLSTMFGYATTMRSLSQGRATYTMQFASYEEVPEGARRRDRRGSLTRSTRISRARGPFKDTLSRSTNRRWPSRSSSGRSRISTSARSVTSTTGRRR